MKQLYDIKKIVYIKNHLKNDIENFYSIKSSLLKQYKKINDVVNLLYKTVKQNRNIYTLRCIKCGDTFDSKHKFSNRKSCRLHSYVRNNKNASRIINGTFKQPLYSSLYISNCLSTSAVILKKELLIKYGGFDEQLMSSQDYDLWLRLAPYLIPYKIDKVLGEYRESTNSITAKFYLYRVFDQLKIAYKYKNYVSYLQFCSKIIKIIFSKQWIYGIKNIILRRKSHNY